MEEAGAPAQAPAACGPEETTTIEPKVPEGALPLVALGRALTAFLPKGRGFGASFPASHVSGHIAWAAGAKKQSWWRIGEKLYHLEIGKRKNLM